MYPRERLNKGKTQETDVSALGCYSLAHSADIFCCSRRSIVPAIRKPEMDKLTKMWILFNLVFISGCQGFRISSCSEYRINNCLTECLMCILYVDDSRVLVSVETKRSQGRSKLKCNNISSPHCEIFCQP